jgi:DNA polymerase III alpha subunit
LFADVLRETYGVIVYQEQLMTIIQRALGGSYAKADLARRIITKGGKKTSDPVHLRQLEDLKESVIAGFIDHRFTKSDAQKWWDELETHGQYSFNKSHSTGYAMIAWQMAYWKYNKSAKFYAECLNIDVENAQDYIMASIADGIRITRPDINKALVEWFGTKDHIILPLSALRFLSVETAKTIVKNRPEGGYTSIKQFMELNPKKVVRAQAREALWFMGAFSSIEGSVEDLELKDYPILTPSETMQKYLGFVIPTVAQHKMMVDYAIAGYTVGIINDRKLRKSSYGPYIVYYLSPTGVFWSREITDLKEGQIVAYQTTGKGRAKEIVRISS